MRRQVLLKPDWFYDMLLSEISVSSRFGNRLPKFKTIPLANKI